MRYIPGKLLMTPLILIWATVLGEQWPETPHSHGGHRRQARASAPPSTEASDAARPSDEIPLEDFPGTLEKAGRPDRRISLSLGERPLGQPSEQLPLGDGSTDYVYRSFERGRRVDADHRLRGQPTGVYCWVRLNSPSREQGPAFPNTTLTTMDIRAGSRLLSVPPRQGGAIFPKDGLTTISIGARRPESALDVFDRSPQRIWANTVTIHFRFGQSELMLACVHQTRSRQPISFGQLRQAFGDIAGQEAFLRFSDE